MSMPLKNVIFAVFLLAIGIVYAVLSSDLPERTIQNVPGPRFFPNIIAGIIIILSLSLLVKGLMELRRNSEFTMPLTFPVKGTLIVVWMALFVAVLPYAGFVVAGIPFFAGLMALCTESRPYQMVIGSLTIPLVLYYLFREGFNILLPTGQWM